MSWDTVVWALATLVVLYLAVLFFGAGGTRTRAGRMHLMIDALFSKSPEVGRFVIRMAYWSRRRFWLRKYLRQDGTCGVEFVLAVRPWSAAYVKELEVFCGWNDISLRSVEIDSGARYLCIDFGDDKDFASKTVKGILLRVFGVEEHGRIYYLLEFGERRLGHLKRIPLPPPAGSPGIAVSR